MPGEPHGGEDLCVLPLSALMECLPDLGRAGAQSVRPSAASSPLRRS